MNLKSWTLDDWNLALQWATTIFTGAAVLTGGVTILVGKKVAARQAAAGIAVEERLAQQQERAAKAEQSLLELQQRLTPRATGERLRRFREYLKLREKAAVSVYYQAGDPEAQNLADNLREVLSEAGWSGGFIIRPLNDTYGEIGVRAAQIDPRYNPVPHLLMDGLKEAGFERVGGSADPTIQGDEVMLIVGTRWSTPFATRPE
jgi:hypothetical protein